MPNSGRGDKNLLFSGDLNHEYCIFLAPLFRSSVGFDRFNDLFETALRNEPGSTYPPTTEKHGDDQYRIVVAAAGFQEEDLELQVERVC
jgi:molecular chaperone IbpA